MTPKKINRGLIDSISLILILILLIGSFVAYYFYLGDKKAFKETIQADTKKDLFEIMNNDVLPIFTKTESLFVNQHDSIKEQYIIKHLKKVNDSIEHKSMFTFIVDEDGVVLVSPTRQVEGHRYDEVRKDGKEFHSNIIKTLQIRNQGEFIVYLGRKTKKSYLGYMRYDKSKNWVIGVSKKVTKYNGIFQMLGVIIATLVSFFVMISFWLRHKRQKEENDRLEEVIKLKRILEQDNLMLKIAAENNYSPMVITDYEGKIIWNNAQFKKQYGEVEGNNVMMLSHLDEKVIKQHILKCTKNGSSSYSSQVGDEEKGKKVMNTILSRFLFDNKDRIIWIDNDITETENIRNFIRTFLSHDLGNSLERKILAIRYQIEGFLSNGISSNKESAVEVLRKLSPEVQDLNDDLLNYLDWGKLNVNVLQVNPKKIDLYELIEREIEKRQIFAQFSKVKLSSDIPKGVKIFADYSLVSAIVRNLIDNAVQAIQKNENAVKKEVNFSFQEESESVKIIVKDTGKGLTEEQKSALFSKDHTDVGNDMRGLGSVICRTFIGLNHGKIWVEESIPGEGTTIIFNLPKPKNKL